MTLALLGLVFPWICLHMVAGVAPWGLFFTARRASLCPGPEECLRVFLGFIWHGFSLRKKHCSPPPPRERRLGHIPLEVYPRESIPGPLNVALGRPLSAELRGIPPRGIL